MLVKSAPYAIEEHDLRLERNLHDLPPTIHTKTRNRALTNIGQKKESLK
jgi:hypothetical protein